MEVPKAIVFDLGRVFVDFDWSAAVRRLLRDTPGGSRPLQAFFNYSEDLLDYEAGLCGTDEFYRRAVAATGYRGALAEFRNLFAEVFTDIPAMVALQRRVRAQGIPTYILSNTNEMAVDQIRRQFAFFADFDGYVYSFEHRALKPAVALYRAAERLAGCQGAEIGFLDDCQENVQAALQLGWQAALHQSPERSAQVLRDWRVLDGQG